jgi:hypothetical protein
VTLYPGDSHLLDPFTASLTCGNLPPAFVYSSLMHITQSALPAEIQVNSSTGVVTTSQLLLPDTYYLLVTGTLPSRQRLSIQLVLNVIERPL